MADWKLIYWPRLPGRGDFVRLMFEEAGVLYDDVCRTKGSQHRAEMFYRPEGDPNFAPVFAPPIIQKGGFVLSQTAAILEYLGKQFGLFPDGGLEEEARAMQINLTVVDYIGEGHDAFHPVKKTGTYDSQKEAAKKYIDAFRSDRLPKYLNHFEQCLIHNNGGDAFFIGEKITYADIAVFQALRATAFQFPQAYSDLACPKLKSFKERMESRPRIKAFLDSDRSIQFCGNSMM